MRHTVVAFDVDGVLADFVEQTRVWCDMPDDWVPQKWDLLDDARIVAQGKEYAARRAWRHPKFVLDMPEIPGAIDVVNRLRTWRGIDVVAVTKPMRESPDWIPGRMTWLRERGIHDVMFTSRKYLVDADVLVEDSPENILHYLGRRPEGRAILVRHRWTADSEHFREVCEEAGGGAHVRIVESAADMGDALERWISPW